jgi:hypothetical protein
MECICNYIQILLNICPVTIQNWATFLLEVGGTCIRMVSQSHLNHVCKRYKSHCNNLQNVRSTKRLYLKTAENWKFSSFRNLLEYKGKISRNGFQKLVYPTYNPAYRATITGYVWSIAAWGWPTSLRQLVRFKKQCSVAMSPGKEKLRVGQLSRPLTFEWVAIVRLSQ